MKELKIFDKTKSGDSLISLGILIRRINQIDSGLLKGKWEIAIGSYGYGELICSIEDKLEVDKQYCIDGDVIFPLLILGNEYFYNAYLKKVDSDIELGIIDTTFLYFSSNNEKLLKDIASFFKEVKIDEKIGT